MGEERGVPRGRGSVDCEQRSSNACVRPAPAILKLCAVGHFVREGCRKARSPGGPGGPRSSAFASRSSDAASSGSGQIDHDAQQLRRHVSSDHGRGLEHVLVARREPIDARREDGLNGLGQCDLLDRRGRRVRTTFAAQRATFDKRANDLLDERGLPQARASIRVRSGASAGSDPSQSSSSVEES